MDRPFAPHIAATVDAWLFHPRALSAVAALRDLASVLSPSDCVGCGASDAVLCPRCRAVIRAATVRPFPAHDGAESLPLREALSPVRATAPPVGAGIDAGGTPGGFLEPLPAVAAGIYRNELAAALLAFKNKQRTGLVSVLGPALAGALRTARPAWERDGPSSGDGGADSEVLLVPVPSRFAARTRRGYAPVDVLAGWVSARGLLPRGTRVEGLLVQRDLLGLGHGAQKGKGRRARGQARGSMSVRRGKVAKGRTCVIVDDVLTTGATVAEAYRCLTEAGARVEAAVFVAATRPPRQADSAHAQDGSADGERETFGNSIETG